MGNRRSALVALAVAATVGLGACATYEGYGSDPYGNAPYGSQPGGYDPRYGGSPGGYDPGYRDGPSTIVCESNDGRTARCPVDTRGGVRLVQRESKASCIEGRSWGQDARGIWVTDGCRARFEIGGGYASPGRGPEGGVVVCESLDERRNQCALPRGVRQVQLVRQLSKTSCRQNANWGFQRGAIWVDRGCRAEFRVY